MVSGKRLGWASQGLPHLPHGALGAVGLGFVAGWAGPALWVRAGRCPSLPCGPRRCFPQACHVSWLFSRPPVCQGSPPAWELSPGRPHTQPAQLSERVQ